MFKLVKGLVFLECQQNTFQSFHKSAMEWYKFRKILWTALVDDQWFVGVNVALVVEFNSAFRLAEES